MAKTAPRHIFRPAMKKLAAILFLFPALSFAQTLPQPFLSYVIKGELDTAKKEFSGVCQVRLENRTNQSLDKLVFRLYPNAFRNSGTTFMREKAGQSSKGIGLLDSGFLSVQKAVDGSGADLTFGAKLDETIYTLPLKTPIRSGAAGTVELTFRTHFPRPVERIGWTKDGTFILAQWYPILAKLHGTGEFEAHPFHYTSEFFSDFANYEVELTVPSGYRVEATGYPVGDSTLGDKKTVRFQAQMVVDFAAVASHNLESHSRIFQGTLLTYFGPSAHAARLEEIFTAAETTLAYCNRTYGPYPYKKLVLAQGPVGTGNGMEFPMLVTLAPPDVPLAGTLLLRDVIIHELAHQWWYQLVATNQFVEPWLDEGFTSYTTGKIFERLNEAHPTIFGRLGFDLSISTAYEPALRRWGVYDSLGSPSWGFQTIRRYFANVYSKATLWLLTVERHVGPVRMNVLLQTYYEKHHFAHPTAKDFLKLAADFVPDSILTPLTKWLYGPTPHCDFAIGNVRSEKVRDKDFKGNFWLFNRGDIQFPVGVRVTFENGTVRDTTWAADRRAALMEITGPAEIRSAEINPGRKIALESDFTNNFRTIAGNKAGGWAQVWRMVYGMESVVSWLSAL